MTYPEYLMLLSLATVTRERARRAEEEGEEYHVCGGFRPLQGGGEARFLIVKDRLRVEVRGADGERVAKEVFGDGYEVVEGAYEGAVPDCPLKFTE